MTHPPHRTSLMMTAGNPSVVASQVVVVGVNGCTLCLLAGGGGHHHLGDHCIQSTLKGTCHIWYAHMSTVRQQYVQQANNKQTVFIYIYCLFAVVRGMLCGVTTDKPLLINNYL